MFLAPAYLWLLILALPLLWRHQSRHHQVFPVSSISFWRSAIDDGARRQRPSGFNSQLLVELFVLLLLTLAAAQFTGNNTNRVAAVSLDNSASMRLTNANGDARLTASHDAATNALRSLPGSQQVALFVSGFGKRPMLHGFPHYVGDVLGEWEPSAADSSASEMLHHSMDWLGGKDHSSRELYYFGDEAMSHWPTVPERIQLIPVTGTASAPNYAVLGVTAKRRAHNPELLWIKAFVGYVGVGETASVRWSLQIEDRVILDGVAELQSGRSEMLSLSLTGHVDAENVTLNLDTDDSCALDNRYTTEIETEEAIRVFVGDSHSDLRKAISAVPGVKVVDLSGSESAKVWFSPKPSHGRPRLHFARPEDCILSPANSSFFQLEHPILDGVDSVSWDLNLIEDLKPELGTEVLAGAGPFSFLTIDGDRRIVRVGFDPVTTGFIHRPGFPIFITNALAWLTAGEITSEDIAEKVTALDPIRTPLRERQSRSVRSKPLNLPIWAFLAVLGLALALLHWRKS